MFTKGKINFFQPHKNQIGVKKENMEKYAKSCCCFFEEKRLRFFAWFFALSIEAERWELWPIWYRKIIVVWKAICDIVSQKTEKKNKQRRLVLPITFYRFFFSAHVTNNDTIWKTLWHMCETILSNFVFKQDDIKFQDTDLFSN